MANLIPLEKAAALLGMSTEELAELRSNNEIFGYRDGSSWKFKMSELERVASDRGIDLQTSEGGSGLDFEVSESVSDLRLDESDELILEESSEDVLGSGDALSFGESDLSVAASSSKKLGSGDTGDLLDDDIPKGESPSDTGEIAGGDDDDLLLSEDDLFSDELSLQDDLGIVGESDELSSDFEDSDLIMEDSDSSTELELKSDNIGLSPNASGISLDSDSLELGGSDIDSLELPDDDDMVILDSPGATGDPDAATVMQEDDFNLTPLEMDDEEESSGSQVIALEDSEIYADESAPTLLGASDEYEAGPQMLVDDSPEMVGMAPVGMGMPAGVAAAPEAPYTLFDICLLGIVLLLLLAGGAVGYDVARNMWQPEDTVVSSGALNMFLEMAGMKD